MKNYLEQLKKYDATPDEAALKRLENRLSLALQNRDAAEVSLTDQAELQRVENWAAEKLGADTQKSRDAVKKVADLLKSERMKSRVTFYYLVAKELGVLNKL
ncbi:DUF2853 family protein [uncultured Bartonella sp.]|uniref:DUF2853 family protein n=1 Tax=uncultured Bartonella sp. TaxID=104108 RepID=UPI0025EAD902|nr:DUF2853 family protein [uncultured Bartonella sp.]